MWCWTALAAASPLDDSLAAVRAGAASQDVTARATVIARTRPPSELAYPLGAADQVDLSLRWWAMDHEPSCRLFEEMHEALRRSRFAVAPAVPPARPDVFGFRANPYPAAMTARFAELTGAPPTWRVTPNQSLIWSGLQDYVLLPTDGMVGGVEHCDARVLLDLRDELVAAGVADQPGFPVIGDLPHSLTLGDRLEVVWSSEEIARGENIPAAEQAMADLLARRHQAEDAVREAGRVQAALASARKSWDLCGGRPCREGVHALLAVRDPEAWSLVDLDRPECAGLVTPTDRPALDKVATGGPVTPALGDLAFGLQAMGCVHGVPARYVDLAAVQRAVAELPASCSPAPAPDTLRAMLARIRSAIVTGCTPAPWPGPP
ncbi:MAG: hypothetical protein ABMA64_02470 [Myxococcota bacterium]